MYEMLAWPWVVLLQVLFGSIFFQVDTLPWCTCHSACLKKNFIRHALSHGISGFPVSLLIYDAGSIDTGMCDGTSTNLNLHHISYRPLLLLEASFLLLLDMYLCACAFFPASPGAIWS